MPFNIESDTCDFKTALERVDLSSYEISLQNTMGNVLDFDILQGKARFWRSTCYFADALCIISKAGATSTQVLYIVCRDISSSVPVQGRRHHLRPSQKIDQIAKISDDFMGTGNFLISSPTKIPY
jgi:hypothetical protein